MRLFFFTSYLAIRWKEQNFVIKRKLSFNRRIEDKDEKNYIVCYKVFVFQYLDSYSYVFIVAEKEYKVKDSDFKKSRILLYKLQIETLCNFFFLFYIIKDIKIHHSGVKKQEPCKSV